MWSRRAILLSGPALVFTPAGRARAAPALAGSWRYAGGATGRARWEQAIDHATEDMIPVVRGIARRMIRERVRIADTIVLAFDGPAIEVHLPWSRARAPASGAFVPWTTDTGEHVHLRHKLVGARLVQILRDKDGTRTNTYVPSTDGTRMTVYTSVRAEKIPAPLDFQLAYRRA